jgi:hypothetical protein
MTIKKLLRVSLFTSSMLVSAVVFAGTSTNAGFTENKGQYADQDGQLVPQVLFHGSMSNAPGVFITEKGLTYIFTKNGSKNMDPAAEPTLTMQPWSRMDMELQGANIQKKNVVVEEQVPGYSNYYLAHCPQGVLGVHTFKKVTVLDVYPGIDWTIYVNEKNIMEYDFIVHPGSDAKRIRIRYSGADDITLDTQHSKLKLNTSCGGFFEGDLFCYEKENGKKIDAAFEKKGSEITFALGNYDKSKTLVIDPPIQWTAPQSGSGTEYLYAITVAKDGTGNTCVTGFTDSPDFPTLNAFQGTLSGAEDMVIERLDVNGARVWSTYYGGSNIEGGKGIDTDVNGNCYVTGYTCSMNMPSMNPIQVAFGGGTFDIALLKFNAAGVRQWATWYGGLQNDYGTGLVEDATGIYITGYTNSSNFPQVNSSATAGAGYDAFVMKMKLSQTVRFARYFGGNDDDKGRAIALNTSGSNVYITGSTLSGVPISTPGVFQPINASPFVAEDAFITEFDTTGSTVVFSTFCGGNDGDFGQGIAVDGTGNVYITGYTLSPDFPIKNPGLPSYVDSTQGSPGTHDGFIVKCNPTGTSLIWGTYYGGSGVDMGLDISWNATSGIYISGSANSTDFPVLPPTDNAYYQATQGDGGSLNDMYIAWFYTDLSRQWSTYYGGTAGDEGHSITTDATGNIYVAGIYNNDALAIKFGPGVLNSVDPQGNTNGMQLFPQPAQNYLQVSTAQFSGSFTAEIVNALGEKVLSVMINGTDQMIDISSLAPGVYSLRLNSGTIIKKFVKI